MADNFLDWATGDRSSTPSGSASDDLQSLVASKADEYGIPSGLAIALIDHESGFNPRAVSPKGAAGLAQLMPATARELGVKNVFDPAENVDGGMRYLRQMYDQFGDWNLALAAYQAGPNSVRKAGGIPDATDGLQRTPDYVKTIMARANLVDAGLPLTKGYDSFADWATSLASDKDDGESAPFSIGNPGVEALIERHKNEMGWADRIPHLASKVVASGAEGLGWIIGAQGMQDWGREARERIEATMMKDHEIAASYQKFENSKGFFEATKTIATEPILLADFMVNAGMMLIPVVPAAEGASLVGRLAFNAAKTAGLTGKVARDVGIAAAEKWAARAAVPASQGAIMAGQTGAQVEDWLAKQPGWDKERAHDVAKEAAIKTFFAATALGAVGLGRVEADAVTQGVKQATKASFLHDVAVPTAAGTALMPASEYIATEARRQADPSQDFDLGKSIATGLAMSAPVAGGIYGARRLMEPKPAVPRPKTEAKPEGPITQVNTDAVSWAMDPSLSVDEAIAGFAASMRQPLKFDRGVSVESMEKGQALRSVAESKAMNDFLASLPDADRNSIAQTLRIALGHEGDSGARTGAIDTAHRILAERGVLGAAEAERMAAKMGGTPEDKQAIAEGLALMRTDQWQAHRENQPHEVASAMAGHEAFVKNTSVPEPYRAEAAKVALDYANRNDISKAIAEGRTPQMRTSMEPNARPMPPERVLGSMQFEPKAGRVSLVDPATFNRNAPTLFQKGAIGAGTARFLQVMGRAFGRDVVFFRQEGNTKRVDGFVHLDHPETVFLNHEQTGAAAFHVMFGHEFFHSLPSDLRAKFIEAVTPLLDKGKAAELENYLNQKSLDKAGILEEIGADLWGNRFHEPETISRLLDSIGDTTIASRMVKFVRDFIAKVIESIKGAGGFKTDQYVTNLEKVRDAWVEGMSEYMKRQRSEAEIGGKNTSEISIENLARLSQVKGKAGERARAEIARRKASGVDADAVDRLAKAAGKEPPYVAPVVPSEPKQGGISTTNNISEQVNAAKKQRGGELMTEREAALAKAPLEGDKYQHPDRSSSRRADEANARLEQVAQERQESPRSGVVPDENYVGSRQKVPMKFREPPRHDPKDISRWEGEGGRFSVERMGLDEPINGRSEEELRIALSAATSKIPGLGTIYEAAKSGSVEAHKLLQDIAADNITHLLSGTKAEVQVDRTTGLYGGEIEPSLGLRVRFQESDRPAVLAALAKFADNFAQEQIHVRKTTTDHPGTVYDDGSYATPVFRWPLTRELSHQEIAKVIEDSGLYGLTFSKDYVEAYHVGDPHDAAGRAEFYGAIERANESLGDRAGSIEESASRLWPYGHGEGTIGYEHIRGDVPDGSPLPVSTATRAARYLTSDPSFEGHTQADSITPEQRARQTAIAQDYERLPVNDLSNPWVRRAYNELGQELKRQFAHIPAKIEVYTGEGEPYRSSEAMRKDVADNNHLYILKTDEKTFGPPGSNFADHPLLADSGLTDIQGRPLLLNDVLRAVHDYFAHSMTPTEFGAKGEEAAWKNHAAMTFSPLAKWALTSETRGQNSWVNFHPDAQSIPRAERFAIQKAALLPAEHMLTGDPRTDFMTQKFIDSLPADARNGSLSNMKLSTERDVSGNNDARRNENERAETQAPAGRAGSPAEAPGTSPAATGAGSGSGTAGHRNGGAGGAGNAQETIAIKPQQADANTPVVGIHYGKVGDLSELNGSRYGEGIKGQERERLKYSDDPRIKRRVYFYPQDDANTMPRPEQGLGDHIYTSKLGNLYDIADDPLNIKQQIRSLIDPIDRGNKMESLIVDAGYDGYIYRGGNMIVVLDADVPVHYLGKGATSNPKFSAERERGEEKRPMSLDEFAKDFKNRVQAQVEYGRMLSKMHDWSFNVGDQLLSTQTGKVYTLTGRTFQRTGKLSENKWKPVYSYEAGREGQEGWERGTFPEENILKSKTLKSLTTPTDKTKLSVARNLGDLTPDQEAAVERVLGRPKTVIEKLNNFRQEWKQNLIEGVFDGFAAIKDLDPKAYMQARLSKGGDSTLEALLLYGKVFVDQDGFYDVAFRQGDQMAGFASKMAQLNGEHDRFLVWVAAQRAELLKGIGLENLFSDADIQELKTLSNGSMKDGTARAPAYAQALADLGEFNDSVLKIAVDSGLIDDATRQMYQNTPYIPFYRLQEEGGVNGFSLSPGIVNQVAWKKLKGGTEQLNADLMANLLQNWSHLITASAKNRAAKSTLEAALNTGIAVEVPNATPGKGLVSFRDGGKDRTFMVSDPHLLAAVSALEAATLGPWGKPFVAMKRALTIGVTANPAFKIRNLMRDSISAIATSDLDYNFASNVKRGWELTAQDSEVRARMLASGGIIRFGSMLDGNSASHAHRLIERGVDPAMILDSDNKIAEFWKTKVQPALDVYQELGDRGEQVNRAALYEQLVNKGLSHGEASYWARDLMDFSSSGRWAAVRTLTQVVPFLNARLQGLYKLGRATNEDIARVGYVLGAVALSSIGLMLAYRDDKDWNKREDWDRQNYWWFKVGDTAVRLPKPFEIGAIGTIAEMGVEMFANKEMTGKRFVSNLGEIVGNQLNMNPVPQLVKPMLDVYANQDSFTKRPIESMAMQRLRPEDRYSARTSELARFFGSLGLPDPVMAMMGHYEPLSPVKVDSLVKGYAGWLGTMVTTALDYGIRPMLNRGEKPEMKLKDVFLAGNFVESLPSDSSRHLTQLYEQAKEIEQAYSSFRNAIKSGDMDKARSLMKEEGAKIQQYKGVERIKEQEARINQVIQQTLNSKTLSAETKRRMLDNLNAQRDRLAQALR